MEDESHINPPTLESQHEAETNALRKVLETPGVDLKKIVTDAITEPVKKTRNREETLLVRKKIKEIAKGSNVSDTFITALEKKVTVLIEESAKRAFLNGRKTILDRDI